MLIHWIISCTEIIQMTYSIHQHWDPLQVCAVGRSYPPEFYSYIDNVKVRTQFEQIAEETEQDYQSLIKLLQSFDVDVVRIKVSNNHKDHVIDGVIQAPPMVPRDWCTMIGDTFYAPQRHWTQFGHADAYDRVQAQGNKIIHSININSAQTTRIGRDLYHGTEEVQQPDLLEERNQMFPEYRNHVVDSAGHSDGVYCPVKPGLIVSLYDIQQYNETFPGWEVVYLPGQSWSKVSSFLKHKQKVKGKWWVPGAELNDDFTEYVESWMSHWVGYVEESVFDVNMLVIDEQNVICNNENDAVFQAFEQHGITPHVCNFRHRYFWDGGIHCVTQDLHRLGKQKDYFPERG